MAAVSAKLQINQTVVSLSCQAAGRLRICLQSIPAQGHLFNEWCARSSPVHSSLLFSDGECMTWSFFRLGPRSCFGVFRSPSARWTRCDEHAADEVSNPIGMKSRRRLSGAAGAVSCCARTGHGADRVDVFPCHVLFRTRCRAMVVKGREDGSVFFFCVPARPAGVIAVESCTMWSAKILALVRCSPRCWRRGAR